jgi:hypothetical protein
VKNRGSRSGKEKCSEESFVATRSSSLLSVVKKKEAPA